MFAEETGVLRLSYNENELKNLRGRYKIEDLIENKVLIGPIAKKLKVKFSAECFTEQSLDGNYVWDSTTQKEGPYLQHLLMALLILGVATPVKVPVSPVKKLKVGKSAVGKSVKWSSRFTQMNRTTEERRVKKFEERAKSSRQKLVNTLRVVT